MTEKKTAKGSSLVYVCPHCSSHNITIEKWNTTRKKEGNTITNHIFYECLCQECHHSYSMDAGNDVYTIYTPPHPLTNLPTPSLLMELKSDFRSDFSLYCDELEGHMIYYILCCSDLPLFLTQKEVTTFLEKPEKAQEYANRVIITRYR